VRVGQKAGGVKSNVGPTVAGIHGDGVDASVIRSGEADRGIVDCAFVRDGGGMVFTGAIGASVAHGVGRFIEPAQTLSSNETLPVVQDAQENCAVVPVTDTAVEIAVDLEAAPKQQPPSMTSDATPDTLTASPLRLKHVILSVR
jgi:hypothetical protein